MNSFDALVIGLFRPWPSLPGSAVRGSPFRWGIPGAREAICCPFLVSTSVPVIGCGAAQQETWLLGSVKRGLYGRCGGELQASISAVHFLLRFLRSHRFTAFIIYMAVGAFVASARWPKREGMGAAIRTHFAARLTIVASVVRSGSGVLWVLVSQVQAASVPTVYSGPTDRPQIALTFDDNFNTTRALAVLSALRRLGPATMFVVGDYVRGSQK